MRFIPILSALVPAAVMLASAPASSEPIAVTQSEGIVNPFALAQVFGVSQVDNRSTDFVNMPGVAGFSIPKVPGDASQGSASVSGFGIPGPTVYLSQSSTSFSFPSNEQDVNLIGEVTTRQQFTLGITAPTTGRIIVDFEHITVRPSDTSEIDYTTIGQITLFEGGTSLGSLFRFNPSAGIFDSEFVYEGLLKPGVTYELAVFTESQIQFTAPTSGDSPQVFSGIDWTLSAEADAAAVPEPVTWAMLTAGVLSALCFAAARPSATSGVTKGSK